MSSNNNDKKKKPQSPGAQDTPKPEAADAAAAQAPAEAPQQPDEAAKAAEEAAKAKEELAAEHDKYLRILAEYDNFRKRSAKERENIYADVRAETVKKFLPVYDNLVRALAQSTEDEAYRKGVEMIMSQFESVLKALGVTALEAVGKEFDPGLHNAVMHIEDESVGEGIVVEEFEKGFKLGDKVIRFSMVKVAN